MIRAFFRSLRPWPAAPAAPSHYCPNCGTRYFHPAPAECDWCPMVRPLEVAKAAA